MQIEIVKFLMCNNADVNAEDEFKNTSLNDAVRHRYYLIHANMHETNWKLTKDAGMMLWRKSSVRMEQSWYSQEILVVL